MMPILAPLAAVGGFLRKGWPLLLAGALALFLGLHLRADARVKAQRDKARSDMASLVASYTAAQENSRIAFEAQKKSIEANFRQAKAQTDAKSADLSADFVARGRVRVQACPGGASSPDRAGEGATAGSPDRAPDTAVVVASGDVDACSTLAARMTALQAWGEELRARGLAE